MRSLLFRHEIKQKHIKKIKSKTYHRLMKKDRLKATSAQIEMDPEAAKEQAMKQEFKRAEVILSQNMQKEIFPSKLWNYLTYVSCNFC